MLAFIGARGMASAMQHAANEVWDVPKADRPSGIKEILRSLALLVVGAGGLVATSVLAGFMTGLVDLGSAGRIAGLALSAVLNVGVFVLSFRIATAPAITTRPLLPGAIFAAVGWTVLQFFGTWLVTGQIEQAGDTYGFFAIVIGLLTFLFIAAQITLYGLELSVVLERRAVAAIVVRTADHRRRPGGLESGCPGRAAGRRTADRRGFRAGRRA